MGSRNDKDFQKKGDQLGVVAKVLDCDIVRSEFELQSRYYVHFRTNTLGKSMNADRG